MDQKAKITTDNTNERGGLGVPSVFDIFDVPALYYRSFLGCTFPLGKQRFSTPSIGTSPSWTPPPKFGLRLEVADASHWQEFASTFHLLNLGRGRPHFC